MKISNDALMASIRAAVADQRAATLAFDSQRLQAANARLDQAWNLAKESMRQGELGDAKANPNPAVATEIRNVQREMGANAELVRQASAANLRALKALMPEPEAAAVYGADGAATQSPKSRPIGQA